jgi:hypothetical protein
MNSAANSSGAVRPRSNARTAGEPSHLRHSSPGSSGAGSIAASPAAPAFSTSTPPRSNITTLPAATARSGFLI